MPGESGSLGQMVQKLLGQGGSKQERTKLLRELVRRGEGLPDGMLDSVLRRWIEGLQAFRNL